MGIDEFFTCCIEAFAGGKGGIGGVDDCTLLEVKSIVDLYLMGLKNCFNSFNLSSCNLAKAMACNKD